MNKSDNRTDSDMFIKGDDPGLLKQVLDSVEESIKIVDRDFRVVFTNRKGEDIAGKPMYRIVGKKCFQEFYKNEQQCLFCVTRRVFETGEGVVSSFIKKENGKERVIEVDVYPLKNNKGEIEYAFEILRDVTALRTELVGNLSYGNILSRDPAMREVFLLIDSVAGTDATVLIRGETGTGKELVARAIHAKSKYSSRKFVPINCGAIADSLLESELFGHERGAFTGADRRRIGKFELAHGGTLFLDEIGNISESMQVKILRVLQEGELSRVGSNEVIRVDVRIIAATNQDILQMIKEKKFREDLYYRINVVPIYLPPLRERGDDIELLGRHFLEFYNNQIGKNIRDLGDHVREQMRRYSWPGNIRELKNLIERAVIMARGRDIERLDITETNRMQDDVNVTLKEWVGRTEKEYLLKILKLHKGNVNNTSNHSGVDTRTLYRKMRQYDLNKELFK